MLISAPAGFGKTTLVSDWIIQQKVPAAWYSIDNSDNDAAEFLGYIIASVQGLFPEFGEKALTLLRSPKQVSQESLVHLLINELLSLSMHFLLVLDDFHPIQNREVLNLFTYFVEHPGHSAKALRQFSICNQLHYYLFRIILENCSR